MDLTQLKRFFAGLFDKPRVESTKRIDREISRDSLTVIVTAVNEVNYIDECIQSIINSSLDGEIELIVVVSGDHAGIREALTKYPDVRVLHHELTGEPGTPRNYGTQYASGDWVAFIDADDVFGACALETRLSICSQHSKDENFVGVAFSSERFTDVPTETINKRPNVESVQKIHIDNGFSCNTFNPVVGCMYRKQALLEIGGFPTVGLAEDLFLLLKIGEAGFHMYASREIDSGYRQVVGSRSYGNNPDWLLALLDYEDKVVKIRAAGMTARSRTHRGIKYGIRSTYPNEEAFKEVMAVVGFQHITQLSDSNIENFVKGGLLSVCNKAELDSEVGRYVDLIKRWGM